MRIYIVITEGIMDQSDAFINVEKIFFSKKKAVNYLKKLVEKDKEINPDWYNSGYYEQNWNENSTYFEIYENGYYEDNHFTVQVKECDICKILG